MNVQIIESMPYTEYEKLERFNSNGIKKILVSAQDFYKASWFNPDRQSVEKPEFSLGTAYHDRVLEGPASFSSHYAPAFDDAAHPDALDSIADIRAHIVSLGGTPKGTKKDDVIEQARALDPGVKILKVLQDKHEALHAGRSLIPARTFKQIQASGEYIESTPDLSRHLLNTKRELTILWDDEETGVPMKARLDAADDANPRIIDAKTFSNDRGVELNRLICNHIVSYGYHIQMATYDEAFRIAFGKDPVREFMFIQTGDAMNVLVKQFPADLIVAQKGKDLMRMGIRRFAMFYKQFGKEQWFDPVSLHVLQDEDFPLWALE